MKEYSINYKYLAIDVNNDLMITVPLVSGNTIGLENTCMSGRALKSFFRGKESVFVSLQKLKDDIENKYVWLCQSRDQVRGLQKIYRQANQYLQDLSNVGSWGQQIEAYSEIPDEILETLLVDPCIGAIGLDPKGRDDVLRLRGISHCSFGIRPSEGENAQILSTALLDFFQDNHEAIVINHDQWKNNYEEVDGDHWKAEVLNDLYTEFHEKDINLATFRGMIGLLDAKLQEIGASHRVSQLFKVGLKDHYKEPIEDNDVVFNFLREQVFNLNDEEHLTYENFVNSMKYYTDWDTINVLSGRDKGVFEKIHDSGAGFEQNVNARDIYEERMNIAIQFLIGTINLVLIKKGKTNSDLGMKLEGVHVVDNRKVRVDSIIPSLLNRFSSVISNDNISFIDRLPDEMIRWMNENRDMLDINEAITDEDIEEIKCLFSANFRTIQGSPHFDEFLIRQNGEGIWKNIEGLIATDFRNILKYGFKKENIEVPDLADKIRYLNPHSLILKDLSASGSHFKLTESTLTEFLSSEIGVLEKMYLRKALLDTILKEDKGKWLHHYFRLGSQQAQSDEVNTLLIKAASENRIEVVKALVKMGANTNIKDSDSISVLICAAEKGYHQVAEVLIKSQGIHVNEQTSSGYNALMVAAELGYHQFVKVLLENKDINLDDRDRYGQTALMKAADRGHREIVIELIKRGADIHIKSIDGRDALTWLSLYNERADMIKLLIDEGANVNPDVDIPPLILAAHNGNLDVVRVLTESDNIDINIKDYIGNTALLCALKEEYREVAKFLINSRGVDLNAVSRWGEVLTLAADLGDSDIFNTLLEKGDFNLNKQNKSGRTVLWHAVNWGRLNIVKILMNIHDVRLDVKEGLDADSLLMRASERGFLNIVEEFVKSKRVDINEQNLSGKTALMFAIEKNHNDVAKYLIKHSNKDALHYKNKYGETALMVAVDMGNLEITRELIDSGSDLTVKNNRKESLIGVAKKRNHKDILRLIIDKVASKSQSLLRSNLIGDKKKNTEEHTGNNKGFCEGKDAGPETKSPSV